MVHITWIGTEYLVLITNKKDKKNDTGNCIFNDVEELLNLQEHHKEFFQQNSKNIKVCLTRKNTGMLLSKKNGHFGTKRIWDVINGTRNAMTHQLGKP